MLLDLIENNADNIYYSCWNFAKSEAIGKTNRNTSDEIKKARKASTKIVQPSKFVRNSSSTYSSGQKFLNDHSIWHNFFVSKPIDLKFLAKLHITIVYFLAKNWKLLCFLAEVMISRVSFSKSKVSKRFGF
jgi:hypothetical protein